MVRKNGASSAKTSSVRLVEERAQRVAEELGLELVEVTLQKESRGKCLCVYADKEGGLSLDDCEKYHRQLQPLMEDIDYDIMEVSSPGLDRPIKTRRDFEKNRDALVEVKLFAPYNGAKLYRGLLKELDERRVTLETEQGESLDFERKAVALIKPIIQLDEEDFENPQDSVEEIISETELE